MLAKWQDYPNPFAPAPSIPLATSGMADYPDPLADTIVAVCPTSNGVYHTVDGTFFKIQCGYHHGTTAVQITTAPSLQKCIDMCSQESSCKSVNYIPSSLGCTLISSTGATTVSEASAGQDYAYKIAPPNQPARDESLVACSTTCPSGKSDSTKEYMKYTKFRFSKWPKQLLHIWRNLPNQLRQTSRNSIPQDRQANHTQGLHGLLRFLYPLPQRRLSRAIPDLLILQPP